MGSEELNAVQFGKLMSSVETLVDTMKEIQKDLGGQRETNAQLQEKLGTHEKSVADMRLLLSGADGQSGLLGRMTGLEQKLDASTSELVELKKAFSDTRALVIKIGLAAGVSATGAKAGVSKMLNIFGM
jgi:hypothetical protein